MKKIYSFFLLSVLLLMSGNAWAQNVAKIGSTEYATFAEAVAAASGLADVANVIELIADVPAADIAVSGKAVYVKHNWHITELKNITKTKTWAQTLRNVECVSKNGNWRLPIVVGDFEACVTLRQDVSFLNTVVTGRKSGEGYDSYNIARNLVLNSDVTLPEKYCDAVYFYGEEEGNPITLNLNAHTLMQQKNSNGHGYNGFACVNTGSGHLVITGDGQIYGSTHGLTVGAGTIATLESGIVAGRGGWTGAEGSDAADGGYHVSVNGTFHMLGGELGDNTMLYNVEDDGFIGRIYASVISYMYDAYNYDGIVDIQDGIIHGIPEESRRECGNVSLLVYDYDSEHPNMTYISGGIIEGNATAWGTVAMTGGEILGKMELTHWGYVYPISSGKIKKLSIQEDIDVVLITGGKFGSNKVGLFPEEADSWMGGTEAGDFTTETEANLSDYVMSGYEVVANTDDDATEYPWKVVLAGAQDRIQDNNDGSRKEWKEAWGEDSEGVIIPTATTPTTIQDHHQVYVADGTVATAYDVTINTNTTLTVENGGTLIVGAGGINGATETNFIVEDGGYVAISPAVAEARPTGTVEYIAKYAGKNSSNDLYWEQIAIPTVGKPDAFTSVPSYFNTWDITDAWVATNRDGVDTPFKGYFISNENVNTLAANHADRVYTFQGELVGNQVNIMKFAREGFTFFGNSYLAPIGIFELLSELNVDNIEATVYIYRPLLETYYSINMATAGRGGRPSKIEPMQGFFVYAADKAHVTPSYMNTVWNALMANTASLTPARTRRTFASEATLTLTSLSGKMDELVAVEGADFSAAFDQNYDARKMMNASGLNLYVPGETDLAVVASNDLDGTPITVKTTSDVQYTFTFSDVAGDLALYDAVTGIATSMTEGATYTFVAQANATISGRFSIVSAPRVATGMENVEADKAGIYTVTGLYLGEAANWDNLPKGVYIVNGQKVVK